MIKVKHEERFARFTLIQAVPNDVGRLQFFNHQSKGILPDIPDPYYVMLTSGKFIWDFTVEQWRLLYGTDEWPGWFSIERDFLKQPEDFNHIFHWHTTRMFPGAQSIFKEER